MSQEVSEGIIIQIRIRRESKIPIARASLVTRCVGGRQPELTRVSVPRRLAKFIAHRLGTHLPCLSPRFFLLAPSELAYFHRLHLKLWPSAVTAEFPNNQLSPAPYPRFTV